MLNGYWPYKYTVPGLHMVGHHDIGMDMTGIPITPLFQRVQIKPVVRLIVISDMAVVTALNNMLGMPWQNKSPLPRHADLPFH